MFKKVLLSMFVFSGVFVVTTASAIEITTEFDGKIKETKCGYELSNSDTEIYEKYNISSSVCGYSIKENGSNYYSTSVPLDEGNRHFIQIQEWIKAGNTVISAYPEVTINNEKIFSYDDMSSIYDKSYYNLISNCSENYMSSNESDNLDICYSSTYNNYFTYEYNPSYKKQFIGNTKTVTIDEDGSLEIKIKSGEMPENNIRVVKSNNDMYAMDMAYGGYSTGTLTQKYNDGYYIITYTPIKNKSGNNIETFILTDGTFAKAITINIKEINDKPLLDVYSFNNYDYISKKDENKNTYNQIKYILEDGLSYIKSNNYGYDVYSAESQCKDNYQFPGMRLVMENEVSLINKIFNIARTYYIVEDKNNTSNQYNNNYDSNKPLICANESQILINNSMSSGEVQKIVLNYYDIEDDSVSFGFVDVDGNSIVPNIDGVILEIDEKILTISISDDFSGELNLSSIYLKATEIDTNIPLSSNLVALPIITVNKKPYILQSDDKITNSNIYSLNFKNEKDTKKITNFSVEYPFDSNDTTATRHGSSVKIYSVPSYENKLIHRSIEFYVSNATTIKSSSKKNSAQKINISEVYQDKLNDTNIGFDSRWFNILAPKTANYDIVFKQQNIGTALVKKDKDQDAFINIIIYDKDKTPIGSRKYNANTNELISIALKENEEYFLSLELENIVQYKYYLSILKQNELYDEDIIIKSDGKSIFKFVVPESTTYDYIINANNQVESKIYIGTVIDDKYLLKTNNNKYIKSKISLKSGIYTLELKSKIGEKVDFLLSNSNSKEEIEPNNTIQTATKIDNSYFKAFYKVGEDDYFSFKADGQFKLIIGGLYGTNADEYKNTIFTIKLYNASGDEVDSTIESISSSDVYYDFNHPSGIYYAKFSSDHDSDFEYTIQGNNISEVSLSQIDKIYNKKYEEYILNKIINLDDVTIKENTDSGEMIIIAGDANNPSDPLYNATQNLSKNFYKKMLLRGLDHKDIYYINETNQKIDIDNDGIFDDIIDENNPTAKKFYDAIINMSNSNKHGPLYIYMVDHGSNGSFKIKSNEIVKASNLKVAINKFREKTKRPVYVIIEACKSGSFIPVLTNNNQDKNIVVITSSKIGELSFVDKFGNVSFSKFLANNILAGNSFQEAYDFAIQKMNALGKPYSMQTPQISIANQNLLDYRVGGDFAAASMDTISIDSYFGKNLTTLDNTSLDIYLKISGTSAINRIWATIIPPNYKVPTVADDVFDTPDLNKYDINLLFNNDTKQYETTYDLDSLVDGQYILTYYIEDSDSNIVSKTILLQHGDINEQDPIEKDPEVEYQNDNNTNNEEIESQLNISTGWNLVSLNTVNNLYVSNIDSSKYESIWKYSNNTWSIYSNDDDILSLAKKQNIATFDTILPYEGFWIYAKKDFTILEEKSPRFDIYENFTSHLYYGWNLLGNGSDTSVEKISQKIQEDGLKLLYTWYYKNNKWYAKSSSVIIQNTLNNNGINSIDKVPQNKGFWVFIN
jgi:hypothetical protein